MVRISEDMIRKRSEHNECVIATLEEISLHQQDIERIEFLDKWCRDLKILLLQSNLIPKIENLGRLKKLEYVNLALNNIERIENLEGCESLTKLDLTVNFIGELTSIESLRGLVHLHELFLMGNPCTDYEGYEQYVIATLPQLQYLDSKEIDKSQRILAIQALSEIRPEIVVQQRKYRRKRDKDKEEAAREAGHKTRNEDDINDDLDDKSFWEEQTSYTPETRIKIHEHRQEMDRRRERKNNPEKPKKERRLQTAGGHWLNINDAKVDFTLTEDDDNNLLLDVAVFRHMDTAMCDVDVQPTYVRLYIKGKLLQLALSDEVQSDRSTAQRSLVTGHLLITMPKVKQVLKASQPKTNKLNQAKTTPKPENIDSDGKRHEHLEVDPSSKRSIDLGNIVRGEADGSSKLAPLTTQRRQQIPDRPNSDNFIDDPSVPPLF